MLGWILCIVENYGCAFCLLCYYCAFDGRELESTVENV